MDRAWQLAPGVALRAAAGSHEAAALAEVFGAFEVREAPGAPALTAEVVGGGAVRVRLDGMALFTAMPEALAPALEASVIGWVVRTRAGVVPLHASAVAWGDKAVLFLGDKGSGKSTLAAQLGAALPYLGDEVAFVRIPDIRAGAELVLAPFPKAATLKQGAFAVVPAAGDARAWRDPLRGPVRYHAPAVMSRVELPVGALVWPQWSDAEARALAAELTPLAAEEAAVRLIHQSFGGLERDARTLDTVIALAALPAYALCFSSAATARDALAGALGAP